MSPERMERSKSSPHETFGVPTHIWEHSPLLTNAMRELAPLISEYTEKEGSDESILKEFKDVYTETKIKQDLELVHRMERAFKHDDSPESRVRLYVATIFEKIIEEMANVWFPDCSIYRAHKYDDYRLQTDLIMEIPDSEDSDKPPYVLALDVTYSYEKTKKKLESARSEYQSGRFHDLEYYSSDLDPTAPKGRRRAPYMVVGTSTKAISQLAWRFNEFVKTSHDPAKRKEVFQELAEQPLGLEIYEEILQQLTDAETLVSNALKSTAKEQVTRHETLEKNLAYLQAVHAQLAKRYEVMKKEKAPAPEGRELPNNVLMAINNHA